MTGPQRKLAVLAGSGGLPVSVIEAAAGAGRGVFVLGFEGETDPSLMNGYDHAWVKLGAVGQAIDILHRASVEDVVMIGGIRRPSFGDLKLDFRGMQLLAKLGLKAARGDDRLLSLIVRELEGEGFQVLGADEVIQPMLAPEGVITKASPSGAVQADIQHGVMVAKHIGKLDIGQAVIVHEGRVLGVEAIEGTDALIQRVARLKPDRPGGVLVKMKKPGQDRRADLPTVGDRTVKQAIDAGLEGLAVHAGHCLLVHRETMIEMADRAGLFIIGIRDSD
ncbi:MAG: UDP-2,3-diacylglucosamine diphosphatase LpxI [Pseudomonadota bacterium]